MQNYDSKCVLKLKDSTKTGISAVLVTHDQVEAMSMCDRIAIMNDGKILQVTTPSEMYENQLMILLQAF